MKIWSIITVLIFLNSTALPAVSALLGWDLPVTNVMLNEEETHSGSIALYEKALPKTLDVHDFIKFFETDTQKTTFLTYNEELFLPPHISIISPPPEA